MTRRPYTELPEGTSSLTPGSVWIGSGRTSASWSTHGLTGLVHHGSQPVSHNARLLQGSPDAPALTISTADAISSWPLEWKAMSVDAWSLDARAIGRDADIRLASWVDDGLVAIELDVTASRPTTLVASLDTRSCTTAVHGNRVWRVPERDTALPSVRLGAANRVTLADWVATHSTYLVPVADQARIFQTDANVDLVFRDAPPVVRPWVADSDVLFIDATLEIVLAAIDGAAWSVTHDGPVWTFAVPVAPAATSQLRRLVLAVGDAPIGRLPDSARLDAIRDRQSARFAGLADEAPRLHVGTDAASRSAREAITAIPRVFEAAMILPPGVTRASLGPYYWVWGWDLIVSAGLLSRWNAIERQRAAIDFLFERSSHGIPHRFDREFRALNIARGLTDALFLLLVHDHLAETDDADYRTRCYDRLRRLWDSLAGCADTDGAVRGIGAYPDNPKALGRSEASRVAIDTGALYASARAFSEIAASESDETSSAAAASLCARIESTYAVLFFDAARGFLRDTADDECSTPQERNETHTAYPVYSAVAISSRLGVPLLLPHISRLADFVETELLGPCGVRAMPSWDTHRLTESIHHSWFFFWDIVATRILRYGGRREALHEYVRLLSRVWERFAAIVELVDLESIDAGCTWRSHGSIWQLNGCVGVYRSLTESFCGVASDAGMLSFLPGHPGGTFRIDSYHAAGATWDITISGDGRYPARLEIDGTVQEATAVVPSELARGGRDRHSVSCIYEDRDDLPVLLDLHGGRLERVETGASSISCEVSGGGPKQMLVRADALPTAFLADEAFTVRTVDPGQGFHLVDLGRSAGFVTIRI